MKRNPKETKNQRRYLRNHMTKWEVRLWNDLKGRKMFGFKVRRQHGFDKYIVDFYCPKLQLAIEVDGDVHYLKGRTERDHVKDLLLKDEGIRMIRIKTGDLEDDYESMLGYLEELFLKRAEELEIEVQYE